MPRFVADNQAVVRYFLPGTPHRWPPDITNSINDIPGSSKMYSYNFL